MSWVDSKVGEFSPFVYGKAIKKQDQLDKGFPVYGSNGIYAYSEKPLVGPYAVIIGRKGSVGKVHLSQQPCWVSDTAFYAQYDSIDEAFFTYYLLSTLGLENMNTDAAVPGLNRDNAHRLEIRVPNSEFERRRLVNPLKIIDDKIELNRQTNQTLEQIAQALFKSWFVDFDPVKAKIAAKQAGGNAKQIERAAMAAISGKTEPELNQLTPDQYQNLKTTAALFPDELVDSEQGEIPKGWMVKSLDEIAHYQNGLALQKFRPENEKDAIPVLKIAQLKKGFADGDEQASSKIKAECIVNNGDIVFSWSGSLMVDIWCGGKVALNQHLFKVTSTDYPKWFYYYYTKHHLAEFQQIAQAKAVTMGHIKREHLKQAVCAVPDVVLLESLGETIAPLLDKAIAVRLENRTLVELRDKLLPQLISGCLFLKPH